MKPEWNIICLKCSVIMIISPNTVHFLANRFSCLTVPSSFASGSSLSQVLILKLNCNFDLHSFYHSHSERHPAVALSAYVVKSRVPP